MWFLVKRNKFCQCLVASAEGPLLPCTWSRVPLDGGKLTKCSDISSENFASVWIFGSLLTYSQSKLKSDVTRNFTFHFSLFTFHFSLTIFHNCSYTKMSIKNWKLAPRFLNTPYTGSSTFKLKCSRDVKFSNRKGAYFYCLKFSRLKHIYTKKESGPCFVKFHLKQTFSEQFSPSIWQTFVLGERNKKTRLQ